MAEEPQPSNVTEGATEENLPAPTGEAAATAKGLSNLDAAGDDENASKKDVDTEALGKAMKNLDVKDTPPKQEVKKIKINPDDVKTIMDEFTFTKKKAEDLLRKYDGDAVKAMVGYVTAAV